jgi:hypothetical protein
MDKQLVNSADRPLGTNHLASVFSYKALISSRLIHSEVLWNQDPSMEATSSAVRKRLIYQPDEWPGTPIESVSTLTRTALEKIFHTFSLGQELQATSATSMQQIFDDHYSELYKLPPNSNYKIYECESIILTDGQITWGFTQRPEGEGLPGIKFELSAKTLALDRYLLSVMRIDILRRVEAI